jgi:myo-inositol-1(or 4)-monophosphatase
MTMTDYKLICREIEKAVRETGLFIRKESEVFNISRTEIKGLHDLVSYVDKESEEMLVERLGSILPEAGFLAEEGTSSKKGLKYCWVIDPLDGTTNFVHGVHPYSISVALTEDNEPVAGVIFEVGGNELFSSWKDGGAWLNNSPVHVSGASSLSESLVATGIPYSDFGRLEKYMNSLTHFCRTTHGIRRFGSAAIDLAYVACGRFEVFYEYGLKPWDIAAGTLMVREAGGCVSDFSGNEKLLTGSEIVAANNLVFTEFLENVSKFMCD